MPSLVEAALQDSLFLGANDTAIPWLYNLLMFGILVVAAPISEGFIFRGFLLHRWGSRWNLKTAVILIFNSLWDSAQQHSWFNCFRHCYNFVALAGLAIFVHSLNNAIAATLEILTDLTGTAQTQS